MKAPWSSSPLQTRLRVRLGRGSGARERAGATIGGILAHNLHLALTPVHNPNPSLNPTPRVAFFLTSISTRPAMHLVLRANLHRSGCIMAMKARGSLLEPAMFPARLLVDFMAREAGDILF